MSNFGSRIFGFFATSGGGGGGGTVTPNPTNGFMPYNNSGAFDDSYWFVDNTVSPPFTTTTSPLTLDFGFKLDYQIGNSVTALVGDFVGNVNECFITFYYLFPNSADIYSQMNGGAFFGFYISENNVGGGNIQLGDYSTGDINFLVTSSGTINSTYLTNLKGINMDLSIGTQTLGDTGTYLSVDSTNKEIKTYTNGIGYGFFITDTLVAFGDYDGSYSTGQYLQINGGNSTFATFHNGTNKGLLFDYAIELYIYGDNSGSTNVQVVPLNSVIKTSLSPSYGNFGMLLEATGTYNCLLGDYEDSNNNTYFGIQGSNQCLFSSTNLLDTGHSSDAIDGYLRIKIQGDATYKYIALHN